MEHCFSTRLKELRIDRKLKQSDIADDLGITDQAISNYELGKREPRIPDLILIADYFHVTIDYLVGRSDEM